MELNQSFRCRASVSACSQSSRLSKSGKHLQVYDYAGL